MAPLLAVFAVCLLSSALVPIAGYPNGRVSVACESMLPQHGHEPQSQPEHNLTVDKTVFQPGDRIKVTLSGSRFNGFFIQARDAENLDGNPVGSFSLIDDQISQLLTCGGVTDSAVSQTSKSRKEKVEFYWVAPDNGPPHVQFLATVVQKYKIYWVKIPGPIISQTNAPPMAPSQPGRLSTASLTEKPTSTITKRFSSSGCGTSKFCVRNPSSCEPENNDQCFFLSFVKEASTVLVEMSGPSQGYVSFALSHDQWMGDDDAYLCVIEDQKVQINPAYMRGRTHPEVASQDVLQDLAWRLEDGVIQCAFRRAIKIPSITERFDMSASYYIFLADGDAEDGRISRHLRQPLITTRMYNITGSPDDVGGSRSPLLIKYHGALMFVAWMTTVSIGVVVARFFKPIWPNSSLFGKQVWFQVHRILMVTTVVLTSVAFVLPFLYRGHWSKRAGYHPYLGCTVMALAILQPVMAVFRPPPHAPRRYIFNWTHWGTGTIARILAVAAMFLGMDVQALNLPDPWDTYTMIGFVLWHVFIDLLLEVHGYCLLQREFDKMAEDEVEILNPSRMHNEGHTFKKIVLTIYICGNFAFLITFLAAIYQI
ncbi:putative ferric-chelate reductase 1 [Spea bombifrons]|uniref:putative ferric-chelate reductase 1 n=1 Tax=Spea bombifrons TaxID=233779 RepID=UPI0023493350|nr:putative ferric-chelate reductase 1 [Spea bombifrons]